MNFELSRMKGMFNKLIELGEWTHLNPLDSLKQLKKSETEMGFLTLEQVEELLTHLGDNKRHLDMINIVKLCLATGARWSEAETLCGAQLSKCKVAYINTKTGKDRSVPIDQELYEQIYKPTSGPLFKPCYKNFVYQVKRKLKMEIPTGQASHILRHTFASHFIATNQVSPQKKPHKAALNYCF
ncbi:tyrosine-type recombinase/integrase [Vibrio sp. SCSIO 43136]|uniref:phage integrase n=1 Tax=Vibrio sp. SCSIO 43136 TaxID=2819101 RepID=UPI002075FE68|nr:tyrosine-type recombinase/integrase [Vibrio sp. SCSIO 43136]USD67159.1 tyrosine-type recombinase/integrase [Vibrio sp. SCSIO 43136]